MKQEMSCTVCTKSQSKSSIFIFTLHFPGCLNISLFGVVQANKIFVILKNREDFKRENILEKNP